MAWPMLYQGRLHPDTHRLCHPHDQQADEQSHVGAVGGRYRIDRDPAGAIEQKHERHHGVGQAGSSHSHPKPHLRIERPEGVYRRAWLAGAQKTFNKIDSTVENLRLLSSKLNSADNSLGKLTNDSELHDSLTNTIHTATKLLEDLRQNPERYLSVRVRLF